MIDQNADRLIHTIGAVLTTAGIIAVIVLFMPNVMASITGATEGYDITYHLNGGSSNMTKQYVAVRTEHTVPLEEPKANGKMFIGWISIEADELSEDMDLELLTKDDGVVVLPGSTINLKANTQMVALWSGSSDVLDEEATDIDDEEEDDTPVVVNDIKLEFNTNGGSTRGYGVWPPDEVYMAGQKISVEVPNMSKNGYVFVGWKNPLTGDIYEPLAVSSGDVMIDDMTMPDHTLVLEAIFEEESFDEEIILKFNSNGGYITENGVWPPDEVYTAGQIISVDVPNMGKNGHVFIGWENPITGDIYKPLHVRSGDVMIHGLEMPNHTLVLKAIFKPI